MTRLKNSRDYIGAVDHPQTGELIQLSGVNDLEKETLELLAEEYHFLSLETRGSDAEDGDAETCEVELTTGGICGRDRPCPYHD